jgi:hypothetical protein
MRSSRAEPPPRHDFTALIAAIQRGPTKCPGTKRKPKPTCGGRPLVEH